MVHQHKIEQINESQLISVCFSKKFPTQQRSKGMADNNLDLKSFLDAYTNLRDLLIVISEQQKQDQERQRNLISKGEQQIIQIEKLTMQIEQVNEKLQELQYVIDKNKEHMEGCFSSISSEQDRAKVRDVEYYNRLKNRLHIAFGVLTSVIVSLFGLIFVVLDKYKILDEIHKLLLEIIQKIK